MQKLEVKPLDWSDLKIFWEFIKLNSDFNFIFRVENEEDLQRWFAKDYINYTKKARAESIAEAISENPNSTWKPSKQINQWLMFYYEGKRVGACNFEGDNEECEVQILMAPYWKNKGLGKLFLFLSEEFIKKNHKMIDYVYANIQNDNIASQKIFSANGYMHEMFTDYYKNLK